jgi:invasion protein IalB
MICMLLATSAIAQQRKSPTANIEDFEVQPPRVQLPKDIQYSAWRKLCFKGSDGAKLCRTTSSGTEDSGETVVRVDLIERVGSQVARLQLFVPQGFDLTKDVMARIDQAAPTRFPYTFCLTNICIAADHVGAEVIGELESGQILKIEQADFYSSTVALNIPLNQFAAAHQGPPAETFNFDIDGN